MKRKRIDLNFMVFDFDGLQIKAILAYAVKKYGKPGDYCFPPVSVRDFSFSFFFSIETQFHLNPILNCLL